MTTLYREFVIKNPAIWETFMAFAKQNVKAMVEAGHPMRIIATSSDSRRNNEQNKRYWGFVLKTVADQAWVEGKQYSQDVWHEYFARKFGVCEDITLPGGEVITRRKSTTQMTVSEFAEYMTQCETYAATKLGVEFVSQV